MRTLVLGLGNPILTDDAVGLRVVERLMHLQRRYAWIEVDTEHRGGLRVAERLVGYDRAVLVDAIRCGGAPGTVRRLTLSSAPTLHSASGHDVDLPTALQFMRRAGFDLPRDDAIHIVGIEAESVTTFGERCTPLVAAAIDRAAREVLNIIRRCVPAPVGFGALPQERSRAQHAHA